MNGPPRIFDQRARDAARRRALARPMAGAEFLLREVADDLADRLRTVQRRFAVAVDLSPSPEVGATIAATGQVGSVVRADTIPETRPSMVSAPENFPFADQSVDLVVSALALHWVEDLPGAFAQIRRSLRPDGLFLAAMLGGDTLTELRQSFAAADAELTGGASPRVAPFTELRAAGTLLQRAGFALPVTDLDRRTVRYDNAFALMRDLRAVGATNALRERSRRPLTRTALVRASEIYADRFSDSDGRVRATFDIISLSGWAPHGSQQKPLRPGSATVRLAEALGTIERPTGEKAGR